MLFDFIFIANLYHHDFIYLYLISDQKISSLIDLSKSQWTRNFNCDIIVLSDFKNYY